jgi:hypothetical protein
MKAILITLIRFAFAAGKLPQAAEVRRRGTLRDKEFARAKDKAGRHFDALGSAH